MATTPTVHESDGKLHGLNCAASISAAGWCWRSGSPPVCLKGLQATDETSYCVELGEAEATRRLHQHWNTFITRDDFAWLQRAGINAVRLPIGHWLFGKDYPYHRSYKEVQLSLCGRRHRNRRQGFSVGRGVRPAGAS